MKRILAAATAAVVAEAATVPECYSMWYNFDYNAANGVNDKADVTCRDNVTPSSSYDLIYKRGDLNRANANTDWNGNDLWCEGTHSIQMADELTYTLSVPRLGYCYGFGVAENIEDYYYSSSVTDKVHPLIWGVYGNTDLTWNGFMANYTFSGLGSDVKAFGYTGGIDGNTRQTSSNVYPFYEGEDWLTAPDTGDNPSMRWFFFNMRNESKSITLTTWGWNSFARNSDWWIYSDLNAAKAQVETDTTGWNDAADALISNIQGKTTTLQNLVQEKLGAAYLTAAAATFAVAISC